MHELTDAELEQVSGGQTGGGVITAFTVQGWNGSAWVNLGSVSGNNLVKRTVNFSAYTTDRIRIRVTASLAGYSRITEVEAWGH